jgi:UDP-N-acetylglucosamine diphosphorylase / glucose-1-phosphate thymidylyltransferase / UDP-N-acetylgalactosamine diphosphorylase / glucosamine-1-phosphate N-acetyltransferase / galactosamine-1-phosphate N-acetyltransferase
MNPTPNLGRANVPASLHWSADDPSAPYLTCRIHFRPFSPFRPFRPSQHRHLFVSFPASLWQSSCNVKAVILAAGKGTRMRELTDALPKPMLRVQGKPILEHILDGLKSAGIRDVFIVTGFQAEVVERHFGSGDQFGLKITYGRQVVQDGTGKAPELARCFVGSDAFLLTYGDILVAPETYAQMIRRFNEGKFSGVITVTASEDVTKGGLNLFDDKFCLTRLLEKPTREEVSRLHKEGLLKTAWYNAGIYIFRPVLFEFTSRLEKSPRGEYELTDAVNGMVQAGHKIAGLQIPGRWVDVRDPEVLAALEQQSG